MYHTHIICLMEAKAKRKRVTCPCKRLDYGVIMVMCLNEENEVNVRTIFNNDRTIDMVIGDIGRCTFVYVVKEKRIRYEKFQGITLS